MSGTITLYSLHHDIIISCFYEKKEDRWMLMRAWTETYEPLGYYFIVSPDVIIEGKVKRTYAKPLKKIEPVVMIRPKAVYDNRSHFGIADELHQKQIIK